MSEDLRIDLDIDPWRMGRNPNGHFDYLYLDTHFPFVEIPPSKADQVVEILNEHIELLYTGQKAWRRRELGKKGVWFILQEDADFFRALLYLY